MANAIRNMFKGVPRSDLLLFVGGSLAALVFTIIWHLFIADLIGFQFPAFAQRLNKYLLTLVMFGLAFVVALVSLFMNRNRQSIIPAFLVRFGLLLKFFGTIITPFALLYATDPTRSVPVGFAAFTTILVGLLLAGLAGNMLAPQRV